MQRGQRTLRAPDSASLLLIILWTDWNTSRPYRFFVPSSISSLRMRAGHSLKNLLHCSTSPKSNFSQASWRWLCVSMDIAAESSLLIFLPSIFTSDLLEIISALNSSGSIRSTAGVFLFLCLRIFCDTLLRAITQLGQMSFSYKDCLEFLVLLDTSAIKPMQLLSMILWSFPSVSMMISIPSLSAISGWSLTHTAFSVTDPRHVFHTMTRARSFCSPSHVVTRSKNMELGTSESRMVWVGTCNALADATEKTIFRLSRT